MKALGGTRVIVWAAAPGEPSIKQLLRRLGAVIRSRIRGDAEQFLIAFGLTRRGGR